jgi:hypothetical protein
MWRNTPCSALGHQKVDDVGLRRAPDWSMVGIRSRRQARKNADLRARIIVAEANADQAARALAADRAAWQTEYQAASSAERQEMLDAQAYVAAQRADVCANNPAVRAAKDRHAVLKDRAERTDAIVRRMQSGEIPAADGLAAIRRIQQEA